MSVVSVKSQIPSSCSYSSRAVYAGLKINNTSHVQYCTCYHSNSVARWRDFNCSQTSVKLHRTEEQATSGCGYEHNAC